MNFNFNLNEILKPYLTAVRIILSSLTIHIAIRIVILNNDKFYKS